MSQKPSATPASMLPDPADFAVRLARLLPGWHEVSWVDATGSTNADMQARLRTELADWHGPLLLGSHEQSAGRGRAGRSWQTQAGRALLFSCGLRADLPLAALPPLSVVAGIAACEALAALLPPQVAGDLSVKWPNDLQWRGAKLAGILAETVVLSSGPVGVILGIGINLRDGQELSQQLGRAVTDWSATGGGAGPVELVAAVALAWQRAMATFAESGFEPFMQRFALRDALAGQDVKVMDDGRVLFEGTAAGTDEHGHLLVRGADGLQRVTVGDVSVRAVDGGAQG
jgi:BirA family biotin operon repressor/biotin-[acetyl-CoA-carboxylase] ligase